MLLQNMWQSWWILDDDEDDDQDEEEEAENDRLATFEPDKTNDVILCLDHEPTISTTPHDRAS